MTLNLSIGLKLAHLRKKYGMTQEQFAEALDISIKHCSSVERGKSCLSLEKLIEVSNFFDVSLDYLLKDDTLNQNSSEQALSLLPNSIISILSSNDEEEIKLLQEYLQMYNKLRNN